MRIKVEVAMIHSMIDSIIGSFCDPKSYLPATINDVNMIIWMIY